MSSCKIKKMITSPPIHNSYYYMTKTPGTTFKNIYKHIITLATHKRSKCKYTVTMVFLIECKIITRKSPISHTVTFYVGETGKVKNLT